MARSGAVSSAEFVAKMLELRAVAPKEYRALLGIARALYATHNPHAPRDREGKKLHARALAKVRPIDFSRAKALPAAVAEVRRSSRRARVAA